MKERLLRAVELVASIFAYLNIIDTERFRSTLDLAWPRIITGFSIRSKQIADLAMVGIAVGTTGTAGLAFAFAYWELVTRLGLGLAAGTVSLVSQNYGGDENRRASRVVKQSVTIAIVFAVPITAGLFLFAEQLIDLYGPNPDSLRHGSVYLMLVAPAALFELFNLIASRTYTGVGDTFTEMVARGGGAALNIVLNAILIFGFGLGVAGAAIGTAVSSGFVTLVLGWGMLGRSYRGLGMAPSPVPVTLTGPWIEPDLISQLLEISIPVIARKLIEGIIVFPLLWIAATFGPVVVAAFEVGRRVRTLINSINWGLSLASSALVGQHLGKGAEEEAGSYGTAIVRLSTVTHAGVAISIVLFATPVASIFVTGPDAIAQTAVFVSVGAVSSVGFGIDGAATGALLGAGDTRWPFVVSLLGRYGFALPVAALGLVTPFGIVCLYLAFLLEAYVPGGVNYWLFRTGRWKAISRRYRSSTDPS